MLRFEFGDVWPLLMACVVLQQQALVAAQR